MDNNWKSLLWMQSGITDENALLYKDGVLVDNECDSYHSLFREMNKLGKESKKWNKYQNTTILNSKNFFVINGNFDEEDIIGRKIAYRFVMESCSALKAYKALLSLSSQINYTVGKKLRTNIVVGYIKKIGILLIIISMIWILLKRIWN